MKQTTLLYTNEDDHGYTNVSFRYVLGFQPSLGFMLLTPRKLHIIIDSRYYNMLENINKKHIEKRIGKKLEIYTHLLNKPLTEIISICSKAKKIALENSVPVSFYENIKKTYKVTIVNDIFEEARVIKQKDEKENIQTAINIIQKVFHDIQVLNKKNKLYGKTELEVRTIIISKIFQYGGEGEGFDTIVAFGANSAIPHHESGDTLIQEGPLLFDMGALYQGYTSDFSRTIWVKKPGLLSKIKTKKHPLYQEFLEIQSIVAHAQQKGIAGVKKGKTTKDIDTICREYITKKGYGDYFTHATGHGVGLEIHEAPGVSPKSESDIIKKGMVFTVEPGIYIPGKFGVRIEDIVVV